MAWSIPTFTAGETSGLTAGLNALATDLALLNASPQINSITTSPFFGTAPSINQPNFLLDINYQTQTTDGTGSANFTFGGGGFPTGVLIVLTAAGSSNFGMNVNLQNSTVTKTGFSCFCYKQLASSTYGLAVSQSVVVQWIAVGF